jgi:hypothetical protein
MKKCNHTSQSDGIRYHPPPSNLVRQYSQDICEHIATFSSESFCHPELVSGLSRCLSIIGEILAQDLNSNTTNSKG